MKKNANPPNPLKTARALARRLKNAEQRITPTRAASILFPFIARGPEFFRSTRRDSHITHIIKELPATELTPGLPGFVFQEMKRLAQRRKRGAFYTPPHVVDYIVKHAVLPVARAKKNPTVLDPACGCGAFLLGAGRVLLKNARPADLPQMLFGIDTDAEAVEIARASLACAFGIAPDKWKNSIIKKDVLFAEPPRASFDAVVGNPPYINLKRSHLSASAIKKLSKFELAKGQWDVFSVFVERAFQMLANDGCWSFIIPKPALTSENYEPLRRLVSVDNRLLRIAPAGNAFPGAGVEGVVLVSMKTTNKKRSVHVDDGRTGTFRKMHTIPLKHFKHLPYTGLSYLTDEFTSKCFAELGKSLVPLGDIFTFKRGVEAGKNSQFIHDKKGKGRRPLITGDDVTPFNALLSRYISIGKDEKIFKPASLYDVKQKLLIRRVASEIIAAVDTSRAWCLNTLYVAVPKEPVNLDAWCAFLNSKPVRRLFKSAFCHDDALFPYLRASQLEHLPVPRRLPQRLCNL